MGYEFMAYDYEKIEEEKVKKKNKKDFLLNSHVNCLHF